MRIKMFSEGTWGTLEREFSANEEARAITEVARFCRHNLKSLRYSSWIYEECSERFLDVKIKDLVISPFDGEITFDLPGGLGYITLLCIPGL